MKVLVDSDFYIGVFMKDDAHEREAKLILDKIVNKNAIFFTTWEVIDEVMTKLSYYASKTVALKFFNSIPQSETIVIYPREDLANMAVEIFDDVKSKNVSLTDCFNAVVFKEYEIDYILSFDKDYKKLGVKIWE